MKRCMFGFILLGLLFAACLWAQQSMERIHQGSSALLTQAADSALDGNWDAALVCSRSAQAAWESGWQFTAVFADHTPMEDVDSLFTELSVYAEERETVHYAAACRELSRRVAAVSDAHRFSWWNVL